VKWWKTADGRSFGLGNANTFPCEADLSSSLELQISPFSKLSSAGFPSSVLSFSSSSIKMLKGSW